MSTDHGDQAKKVIDQLQVPVRDLPTLLALLSGPLDCLGLLPPQYRRYNTLPLPNGSINIRRHIPAFQRVLLQHIAPTWDTLLTKDHTRQLLDQYFCPDSFSYATPVAGEIAMLAFSTIISLPLTEHAMRLLQRLAKEYPIDRLHTAAFARKDLDAVARGVAWEDCIRNIVMVPAKVANAVGTGEVLSGLQHATYFNYICERTEVLIATLASKIPSKASLPSIAYLMSKLVNLGVFPPSPPVARSQPSFFQTVLPTIRTRLLSEDSHTYSSYWSALITNIPSSLTLQSILTSLYASLSVIELPLDVTPCKRSLAKSQAWLLSGILGDLTADNSGLWDTATNLMTGRDWDESFPRIFVCWVSGGSRSGKLDTKALDAFLETVLDTWSSADHIKHSLLSRHRYMTALFLITVSYFPASSEQVQAVALSPMFIRGIGTYISHSDLSVRRCGMLAGEVVAHLAGKKLDFRDWDGDDSGKPWARDMREFLKARDMDADLDYSNDIQPDETGVEEISTPGVSAKVSNVPPKVSFVTKDDGYDSDDSVTGYASPPSSRSVSPTPSDLASIEKDPTLNVGVKKVPRPMYLVQVGNLVRGSGPNHNAEDPHDADKIEMALNCTEELVRKKIGYGTELDENAVNLVHAFLGLQDNYDLDDFGSKRQGIMNALVSCAPRKAAPSIIEEFFKNQYSTDQRFVALNALAIGARELASLPVPPSAVSPERIQFPSKTLPGPLHNNYIKASSADQELVPRIMDSISTQAIDKQKEPSSDKVPQIVRERRLRINKPPGITEVSRLVDTPHQTQQFPLHKKVLFTEIAAEFFIVPLVNRFWLFLRDEQTREERTAGLEGRSRYYGAGTGLILNPVVLSHFLRTLAILVNASQNAPEWLAIIAPDTLELAVTIGTRPISHMDDDEQNSSDPLERGKKEASVLTSALELALVVLDGSLEVDGGKSMSLEHTSLLLGTGEWASKIFANLDKGMLVEGGGGMHEMKLRRATAGVLLKVDDMSSRWRRSMIDTIY